MGKAEPERVEIYQELRSEMHLKSEASRRWPGTILFVDDEEDIIELMRELFEGFGVKLVAQTSAVGALRVFSADPHAFDLVITDYLLPNVSGIDLIKDLLQCRSNIPVIMCTGLTDSALEKQARESGVIAFLRKPYTIFQIMEAIENVFNRLNPAEDRRFAFREPLNRGRSGNR